MNSNFASDLVAKLRDDSEEELRDILGKYLRAGQFRITRGKRCFEVELLHVPSGMYIPGNISYWQVNIKKVRKFS
jgi:hypothetical protein